MELTVLGCSGSFGGAGGAACSGYLLRSGDTSVWVDCGNGTFGHLQDHLAIEEGSEAFGTGVTLATEGLVSTI